MIDLTDSLFCTLILSVLENVGLYDSNLVTAAGYVATQPFTTFYIKSNQFARHRHNIEKQKRTQCGATGSSQRANALPMGYPVTKTIRTKSNATRKIKNYQSTQET